MKFYQKLSRFPLGAISPEGFLKEQFLRSKDGMGGHLDEIEPEMIALPYINKTKVPRWADFDQSGWGAEISGNYWTGLIQLAFTLKDEELIAKATNWVNAMVKNQKADGYLGTYYEDDAKIYEDYNAWGTACGMRALLAFYEATGREDILEAVHRCMLWFCDKWSGDRKTSYGGIYIIVPMLACYEYTKDHRLVDFCKDYTEYLGKNDIFQCSYINFLNDKFEFNHNHTVAYGMRSSLPALLYTVTGEKKYLKASEKAIERVRKYSVHPTGAPVSISEYLGPVGSTSESEYCNFAFYNKAYSDMSYITGEAKYGDYMEEMFYNAAQGARKKDERAIAYFSAPNQIHANPYSSSSLKDFQVYSPCYTISCCPVTSVMVLPEFVRGMMLKDDTDNVYITAYGPCSLNHKDIKITENTLYPFRNKVDFVIDSEKSFSVFLKIPNWCNEYKITLNGKEINASVEKGYAQVANAWKSGDILSISFKEETKVFRVDDSYASKKYPIAVKRGALIYSYHIPESWWVCNPTCAAQNTDKWPWWNISPVFQDADVEDQHEKTGLRKYNSPWYLALSENLKAEDIEIEETDTDGYVWEVPPIKLHLKGWRAPYLCAPYADKVMEPYGDKQTVDKELDLELVPYGCTNLRITYFPVADL